MPAHACLPRARRPGYRFGPTSAGTRVVACAMTAGRWPFILNPPISSVSRSGNRCWMCATNLSFADLPPTQLVPQLADEGVYLASESTFYRILRDANEQHHRGRSRTRTNREPTRHVASCRNAVWCWDVMYLPSLVRGLFFYLFAVIDLYSRKIVAWEVHARASGDETAVLIERPCWREHILGPPLILHADNGAAQKAYTLNAKLEALGVVSSHSRPDVSDDNPHIESWFRTVKYMPAYPAQGFAHRTGYGSIRRTREIVSSKIAAKPIPSREHACGVRRSLALDGPVPPHAGVSDARSVHPLRRMTNQAIRQSSAEICVLTK